jgi:hypothetical protein
MSTEAQVVRYFDKFLTALEGVTTNLQDQITAIAAAQAAADAAAAAAATAQTTATTAATDAAAAQTTADAVNLNDKIGGSYVIPADALSASDAGTNATITIAANTRVYNDASTLAVAGGSITGLAYSTTYGVYYDDPTTADTTPTYVATATLSNALNNFVTGRHFVGNVTTPAAGGTSTSGGYTPPATDPADRNKFSTL